MVTIRSIGDPGGEMGTYSLWHWFVVWLAISLIL